MNNNLVKDMLYADIYMGVFEAYLQLYDILKYVSSLVRAWSVANNAQF